MEWKEKPRQRFFGDLHMYSNLFTKEILGLGSFGSKLFWQDQFHFQPVIFSCFRVRPLANMAAQDIHSVSHDVLATYLHTSPIFELNIAFASQRSHCKKITFMHVWLNLEPSPGCDFSDTMQCIFKSKSLKNDHSIKLQAFDSQNKWVPCNDPSKQTLSPRSTSKYWYQVTKASNLGISRFSAKTDSQPPSATGNIFLHMAVSRVLDIKTNVQLHCRKPLARLCTPTRLWLGLLELCS